MARRQAIRYKNPMRAVDEAEQLARGRNCTRAVLVFGDLSRDAALGHQGSEEAASQVFTDLIHLGCIRRIGE